MSAKLIKQILLSGDFYMWDFHYHRNQEALKGHGLKCLHDIGYVNLSSLSESFWLMSFDLAGVCF